MYFYKKAARFRKQLNSAFSSADGRKKRLIFCYGCKSSVPRVADVRVVLPCNVFHQNKGRTKSQGLKGKGVVEGGGGRVIFEEGRYIVCSSDLSSDLQL